MQEIGVVSYFGLWFLITFSFTRSVNIYGIHTKAVQFCSFTPGPSEFFRVDTRIRCSLTFSTDDPFHCKEYQYIGYTHKISVVLQFYPWTLNSLRVDARKGVVSVFCFRYVTTFSLIRGINIQGIHTKRCSFVVLPLVPENISRLHQYFGHTHKNSVVLQFYLWTL